MAYKTTETVISHLSTSLDDIIADNGQKYVAHIIGHDRSTISKRSSDINQYSLADGIRLALKDESFRLSIMQNLQQGHATSRLSPEKLALCNLSSSADLISEISEALRDGNIDASESQSLREKIHVMQGMLGTLNQSLIEKV